MATKKSAAETEIEKVEAAYIKLHPLASKGNDVSPITRGELRMILEDMLGQMAGGASAAPADLSDHLKRLDTLAGQMLQIEGKLMREKDAIIQRLEALETGALTSAPKADAPVASKGDASTVQLNTAGKDELMKLGLKALLDFAKQHNIDVSGLPQDDKGMLAEYIAANMNLPK